ncbi:MAG: hypothetical protein AB1756_05205 [Acidobacteriota bacterium]
MPLRIRLLQLWIFSLIIFTLLFFSASVFAEIDIIKFEDVRAGMKGVGKTVFGGTKVEEFQVEILGKLEKVGPKQNIILARLSGGPLGETGVLSGMSGSPVYIDGKLVGATAFMWGFSKEAIAGITPIEEMLQIEKSPGGAVHTSISSSRAAGISTLFDPERLKSFLKNSFFSNMEAGMIPGSLSPIGMPLVVSGFNSNYIPELEKTLSGTILSPMQVGGSSKNTTDVKPKLEPGSAVGIQLIKGDINLSAVGTVTAVDGDRILAFGHPLFNIGRIDIPMTAAKVETLLPNLAASFKIADTTTEIGTFTEDRASGMAGRLGQKSKTIPVRVEISTENKKSISYSFDVIDHKLLTPVLLFHSLNSILSSAEKEYGDATIGFKEGSMIRLSEERSVNLVNLYSGDYSKFISTATLAFITYLLMDNEYSESRIEGINLLLDYFHSKKMARLGRVWCDRSRIKPGEKLQVSISVKPYRGREITEVKEVQIPEEIPPGKLYLQVGDAYVLSRMEAQEEMFVPRDFDHLLWLLNNLRTNDKIYLLFMREDRGILIRGVRLPNLPISRSSIIIRPQTKGNYLVMDERAVLEESIKMDYTIEGYKKIALDVEEK